MGKSTVVRGKPKSGRVWKTPRASRYSSIKKEAGRHTTWAEKMELKDELKRRRVDDSERKEKRAHTRETRRLAENARQERRAANERRAETVVPVCTFCRYKMFLCVFLALWQEEEC